MQSHDFHSMFIRVITLICWLGLVSLTSCGLWSTEPGPPSSMERPDETALLVENLWQLSNMERTSQVITNNEVTDCTTFNYTSSGGGLYAEKDCDASQDSLEDHGNYYLQFHADGTWEEFVVPHSHYACVEEVTGAGRWRWVEGEEVVMFINEDFNTPGFWHHEEYSVQTLDGSTLVFHAHTGRSGNNRFDNEVRLRYEASDRACAPQPYTYEISPEKGPAGTEVVFSGLNLDADSPVRIEFHDQDGDEISIEPTQVSSEKVAFLVPDSVALGEAEVLLEVGAYRSELFKFRVTSVLGEPWQRLGELPNGARRQMISFSIGERFFVGGGYDEDGRIQRDFWVYENDTWRQLADLPGNGWEGTITLELDRVVYALLPSYDNDPRPEVWQFDENSETWTRLRDFPGSVVRDGIAFVFKTTANPDGVIYFGGGRRSGTDRSREWWMYVPALDDWKEIGQTPAEFGNGNAFFQSDLLGFAGLSINPGNMPRRDLWQFDPETETWSASISFPTAGIYDAIGAYVDGAYYVGGGLNMQNNTTYDNWWRFNPSGGSYRAMTPHPGNGGFGMASFVLKGEIYFLGGAYNAQISNEIWVYNPAADG